jgi:hypothetical protein
MAGSSRREPLLTPQDDRESTVSTMTSAPARSSSARLAVPKLTPTLATLTLRHFRPPSMHASPTLDRRGLSTPVTRSSLPALVPAVLPDGGPEEALGPGLAGNLKGR